MTEERKRFVIDVSDRELEDLRMRLSGFRPPTGAFSDDGWMFGIDEAWFTDLVEYWRQEYDWRRSEREINGLQQFIVKIAGQPIHFVYERGKGPAPIPIVLLHGWPWTFWDFHKVIGPLSRPGEYGGDPADAFDVVVPSLPGFAFSTPLSRPGLNFWTAADIINELMGEVLGYETYVAQGGDWGAYVAQQLGHKFGSTVRGVHVTNPGVRIDALNTDRPWNFLGERLAGIEGYRSAAIAYERDRASHVAVHTINPMTLAQALNDSPVGLAAWILEKRRNWGDRELAGESGVGPAFDPDFLITTVMIYWITQSIGSSMRFYAEAANNRWAPSHRRSPTVESPLHVSVYAKDVPVPDLPPSFGSYARLDWLREHPRGGHFVPAESPGTFVEDLRECFRPLRAH